MSAGRTSVAAAVIIAALWLAFAATHMTLASVRQRPRLVSALGALGYQGVYSLVALALFAPLVWVYFHNKHAGPLLWYAGGLPGMRALMYGGMGAALVLVVGGMIQPSPAGMAPADARVRGILRITRHPVFMGAGLFGLMHLLMAPVNASELAFFGGFPVFAALGCRHQDQRKLVTGGEDFRRFHAETAFLPFTRSGALRGLREMPLPVAIALGIALAWLLRTYHASLFG
jgi:uncharacterized membrane protein